MKELNSLYDLVGGETGLRSLVDRFYDLMDSSPEAKDIRAFHAKSLNQSREYCFKIDTANNNWCKCWLITGENEIYLGAESLKYLKAHLLAGLDDGPEESSGRLLDYNFSWVLSLSEVHAALYVALDGQDRVLLFQDANAKEVCRIRLSQDQCSGWLHQIKSI